MARNDGTLLFEGARLVFRNFSGKEGMYNQEGDRNFNVVIDPSEVQNLMDQGWNIKSLKPMEEGDDPLFYLPVSVGYKVRPPKVTMITSRNRTHLDEETVGMLDYAEFENVDLIVRPYDWTVNGKSGTKAYLDTMFVTISENELERKYAHLEEE